MQSYLISFLIYLLQTQYISKCIESFFILSRCKMGHLQQQKPVEEQKDIIESLNQNQFIQSQLKNENKEQFFKQSPQVIQYKQQFFNFQNQIKQKPDTFDLSKYQTRFTQYDVIYVPKRTIAMPFTLYKNRQQMGGKIKNYIAKFSYFSVKISIFNELNQSNLDCNLFYQNFMTSGSFGNICSYQSGQQDKFSQYVIKLIKFNQTPWQLIYSAIKEYSFMKVLAALKIGPQLKSPFGFDILTTSNYVIFSMEKGIRIEELLQNINSSQKKKKIHKYLNDLEQQIKILHYLNIVHVDIKPQNIIFSSNFQKLVFIDFGLSEALKFPLGTLQLASFSGSFLYCSAEMKRLFSEGGCNYVDLYFNDFVCWKNTRQWIEQQDNNMNFSLSSDYSSSFSIPVSKQILSSFQTKSKNIELKNYFNKTKIIYNIHYNTKEQFSLWLNQNQIFKEIMERQVNFFTESIESGELKQFVYRQIIIDSHSRNEQSMEYLKHASNENIKNQKSEIQSNLIENQLKNRYNNEYFLQKQSVDDIFRTIKNSTELSKQMDSLKKIPISKLKQAILKAITNQFGFFKGHSKDIKQMHKYFLETIKLVLKEDQQIKVQSLQTDGLIQYCLQYCTTQIQNLFCSFSVHQTVYQFIQQQINPTPKINKFAIKFIQSKIQIPQNNSQKQNCVFNYQLSFFYFDLENYLSFLIDKFESESVFEVGYVKMEKIKNVFYTKLEELKELWELIDQQFRYSQQTVSQYLSSQIIKTYAKQLLLRCSYFYCKLIAEVFFFAHEKCCLPEMLESLKQICNFNNQCKNSSLLENMLQQEVIFLEYQQIMKLMFSLYVIPARSYQKISLRQKTQTKLKKYYQDRYLFRKDQYKHVLLILNTIYIRILSSQNLFSEVFVILEKCLQIVRYWRCYHLFANVITIMIQFNNDQIITKTKKYLDSTQGKRSWPFQLASKKLQKEVSPQQKEKFPLFWEQHLIRIFKLHLFEKINVETTQFLHKKFIQRQQLAKKSMKIDKLLYQEFQQTLKVIEIQTFKYLNQFYHSIDTNKNRGMRIFNSKDALNAVLKDIHYDKQICSLELILINQIYFQKSLIQSKYSQLLEITSNLASSLNKRANIQKNELILYQLQTLYLKIIFLKQKNVHTLNNQKAVSLNKNIVTESLKEVEQSFLQMFQQSCFLYQNNDLTYLQVYLQIRNSKIDYLKLYLKQEQQNRYQSIYSDNYRDFNQQNKKIDEKNRAKKGIMLQQAKFNLLQNQQLLKINYEKLFKMFIYMTGSKCNQKSKEENLNSKRENYICLIFTLKQPYFEINMNLCNFFIIKIKEKIVSLIHFQSKSHNNQKYSILQFLQNKNHNQNQIFTLKQQIIGKQMCEQQKINQQILKQQRINKSNQQSTNGLFFLSQSTSFKEQIKMIWFLYQELTNFTTKYPCKNYSEFVFRISQHFVQQYKKLKNEFKMFSDQNINQNQHIQELLMQFQLQLLQKIESYVCSTQYFAKKILKQSKSMQQKQLQELSLQENQNNQDNPKKARSKQLKNTEPTKFERQDQNKPLSRQNNELILVCFILLKISLQLDSEKSQKLIKTIVMKQVRNLYKWSKKIIKQKIQSYLLQINKRKIQKMFIYFGQLMYKSKQYKMLNKHGLMLKRKINKKNRIYQHLKRKSQLKKYYYVFPQNQ